MHFYYYYAVRVVVGGDCVSQWSKKYGYNRDALGYPETLPYRIRQSRMECIVQNDAALVVNHE
jgi:hypothetical protein